MERTMGNTSVIHLDGSEEITFPTIDEMRRNGKIVSVKFGPNMSLSTEVTRLFQESVRRAQRR